MKTKTWLPVLALIAPVAFIACKKEEAPAEPAPAAEPAPPPTPVTTATAENAQAAAASSDIPTVEDFEEEALEDITVENMEAELNKLEKEINE